MSRDDRPSFPGLLSIDAPFGRECVVIIVVVFELI